MKKVFLIDAYALIFRSYYAFIKNPRINSKGLNTSAIFGFTNTILELLRTEQPHYIAICFDPPGGNFRHELYPAYKANRDATPEDIKKSIPYIKNIIRALNIPIIEVLGYEADDVIGTMAKRIAKEGHEVYMMTPDKDYAQLVEEHIYMYKPRHFGNGIDILGLEEVKEKFHIDRPIQVIDILALWGDSADNIPGAPGIGEKTAQKMIAKYGSVEEMLNNTQSLKGKQKEKVEDNIEQILLSKKLATICLDVPIEYELKDLEIENPNTEQIKTIFADLEFRTLLQKIETNHVKQVKVSKENNGQLDLFSQSNSPQVVSSVYANIEEIDHNYILIDNEASLNKLIEDLSAQKSWCFDTETDNIDAISANLVGIAFCWKAHHAYYLSLPEDFETCQTIVNKLKPLFENTNIEKIGQNLKYDILVLKKYGIEVLGDLFDTMIAHYLLLPDSRHNMDFLAETYLGYQPISIETLIGKKGKNQTSMRQVEPEKAKEYAGEDADITWQLAEILRKDLKSKQLIDLYFEIEIPLISVLAEMEFRGVILDVDYLNNYSKKLTKLTAEIEQKIFELAGEEFNVASPKQLGIILFEKLKITDKPPLTKTKQYKTGEEIIVKFQDKHPIIEKILQFRGLRKLTSTYVDALPLLINKNTGRIHTSFNQAVAATGRLSSTNPNLQNIPIREAEGREIRKAFVPSSDKHIFLSADYSQVELRLMAHLSQDENMLDAFNSGIDIHTATAAKIFKKNIEEITKDERSYAKSANFGIIYGISAFGLSQNIGISRTEAKELIEGYFDTYSKVKSYMDKSIEQARNQGYALTIFGRRRTLSDINSQNSIVRGVAERNAINAPIQGTAADIIKIAMIRIHKAFKQRGLKSEMLIQVHDELNFNVLKSELDEVKKIVKYEMEEAVKISVPLEIEMGIGANWLEAH